MRLAWSDTVRGAYPFPIHAIRYLHVSVAACPPADLPWPRALCERKGARTLKEVEMAEAAYRALVGIDYPPNRRAEAGDVITDLPGAAIKGLVADGSIERVDGKPAAMEEE